MNITKNTFMCVSVIVIHYFNFIFLKYITYTDDCKDLSKPMAGSTDYGTEQLLDNCYYYKYLTVQDKFNRYFIPLLD